MAERKHPYIVITDMNSKELEALLAYMYNGEVIVQRENIPNVMKAAEYLKIKGLLVQDEQLVQNRQLSGQQKRSHSAHEEVSRTKRRKESCFRAYFPLEMVDASNELIPKSEADASKQTLKTRMCAESSQELMAPDNDPLGSFTEVSLLNTQLLYIKVVAFPVFIFIFTHRLLFRIN